MPNQPQAPFPDATLADRRRPGRSAVAAGLVDLLRQPAAPLPPPLAPGKARLRPIHGAAIGALGFALWSSLLILAIAN